MLGALLVTLLAVTPKTVTFPGTQPQLAAASGRVGLVFGREGAIFFASSRSAGRLTLAEGGRAPALLALGDGSLLVAWEQDERVVVAPIGP